MDIVAVGDILHAVQEFFAPIAAAKADSWEGTGLEGGGEAMSAVLDLIRQHKVSPSLSRCAEVIPAVQKAPM